MAPPLTARECQIKQFLLDTGFDWIPVEVMVLNGTYLMTDRPEHKALFGVTGMRLKLMSKHRKKEMRFRKARK